MHTRAHTHTHTHTHMRQIEEALEALPGVGDVTAWYHSTPLPQDRLGKFCPGWRAFIQFETTPGDLPLLDVGTGNLTGDGLEASIREVGVAIVIL